MYVFSIDHIVQIGSEAHPGSFVIGNLRPLLEIEMPGREAYNFYMQPNGGVL
jgi:hypothetical protein